MLQVQAKTVLHMPFVMSQTGDFGSIAAGMS